MLKLVDAWIYDERALVIPKYDHGRHHKVTFALFTLGVDSVRMRAQPEPEHELSLSPEGVLLMSDIPSLLSTVGRDLSAAFGIFLDFWYCLVVPEAEYVEQ